MITYKIHKRAALTAYDIIWPLNWIMALQLYFPYPLSKILNCITETYKINYLCSYWIFLITILSLPGTLLQGGSAGKNAFKILIE